MLDEVSIKRHRKDVFINEDTVPIQRVLEDMYDPNGGPASSAAKEYYYLHYATDAEREMMEKANRRFNITMWLIIAGIAVLIGVLAITKYLWG